MPKMCTIPQLVWSPLNSTPTVEHSRWSHPRCENSYRQGERVGKEQRKYNALNN